MPPPPSPSASCSERSAYGDPTVIRAENNVETAWPGVYTSVPSGSRGHAAAFLLSALFFQKPGVRPSAPVRPRYAALSCAVTVWLVCGSNAVTFATLVELAFVTSIVADLN